jgi:hypothetical protein
LIQVKAAEVTADGERFARDVTPVLTMMLAPP